MKSYIIAQYVKDNMGIFRKQNNKGDAKFPLNLIGFPFGKIFMNLQEQIIYVIKSFCKNNKMFTSLDISNCVKESFAPQSKHRNIAKLVRYAFIDGLMSGYDRTLINLTLLNGEEVFAYLYHTKNDDISSYEIQSPVLLKETKESSDCSIPNSIENSWEELTIPQEYISLQTDGNGNYKITSKTNNNIRESVSEALSVLRNRKGDGRLEVPYQWVRGLEWQEKKPIVIIKTNGGIGLIDTNDVEDNDEILCITHISHGRLRVPKTAFLKRGINEHKCKIEQAWSCGFVVEPVSNIHC